MADCSRREGRKEGEERENGEEGVSSRVRQPVGHMHKKSNMSLQRGAKINRQRSGRGCHKGEKGKGREATLPFCRGSIWRSVERKQPRVSQTGTSAGHTGILRHASCCSLHSITKPPLRHECFRSLGAQESTWKSQYYPQLWVEMCAPEMTTPSSGTQGQYLSHSVVILLWKDSVSTGLAFSQVGIRT